MTAGLRWPTGFGHLGPRAAIASAVGIGAYFGEGMKGSRTFPCGSIGRNGDVVSAGRVLTCSFSDVT